MRVDTALHVAVIGMLGNMKQGLEFILIDLRSYRCQQDIFLDRANFLPYHPTIHSAP